jgi:hypothetical protein
MDDDVTAISHWGISYLPNLGDHRDLQLIHSLDALQMGHKLGEKYSYHLRELNPRKE